MNAPDPYLGIHSTQRLRALGQSAGDIRRLVADGSLRRIRRGWFADPSAQPDAVDAARVGGVLTATSGGPHRGMWSLADDHLHVLVARNASRLGELRTRSVCLHWASGPIDRDCLVADPLRIVLDSAHCQPRETAVVLADSGLNRRLIAMDELAVAAPRLAACCDPASQSGTETLVRLGLRRLHVKFRIQVPVDRVGIVDLLVGNRLVIECDSKGFHDGYVSIRDYERDQELLRQGFLVLRLKYRHVVHEWPRVEALILEIIRSRRHLPVPHGVAG